MRKVFLAIPALTGKLADATEAAVQWIKLESAGLGWEVVDFRWSGDSIITHARNVCLAKFLESDCTDIFCLDSDVGFGPGVFTRMMSYRVPFVAGVYRVKCEEERYAVRYLPDRPELRADPSNGLLEVQDVPFGCVRMDRQVVEAMRDAESERWFMAACAENLKCWLVFDIELRNNQLCGEDYVFCRKYRELGGKVWIDPELRLQHVGQPDEEGKPKRFMGSLGDYLRRVHMPKAAQ